MSDSSSDESIEPISPTTVNVVEDYDYVVEEKPKKIKKVKKN